MNSSAAPPAIQSLQSIHHLCYTTYRPSLHLCVLIIGKPDQPITQRALHGAFQHTEPSHSQPCVKGHEVHCIHATAPNAAKRSRVADMWLMQMGRGKSVVTNAFGNRENHLSPEQMKEAIKMRIYYLWAMESGSDNSGLHIPCQLGPLLHTECPLRQLFPGAGCVSYLSLSLSTLMLMHLTHYDYVDRITMQALLARTHGENGLPFCLVWSPDQR